MTGTRMPPNAEMAVPMIMVSVIVAGLALAASLLLSPTPHPALLVGGALYVVCATVTAILVRERSC